MKNTRIAYLSTVTSDVFPLVEAGRELKAEGVESIELCIRTGEDLLNSAQLHEFIDFSRSADIVIFHFMGGKNSFAGFNTFMTEIKDAPVKIFAQGSATEMDIELIELSTVEKEEYRTISRYINYGGAGNSRNLLLHLANYFSAAGFSVAEAERPPWEGIYHPDFTGIPSLQEYLAQKYIPGRPTLGLWFYQSFWQSRNTLFIDSLIKEIEKQQANVIPVFTYSVKDVDLGTRGLEWVVENYFMDNGRPVIDMLISPLMFSLSMRVNKVPGGSEVLPEEEKGILKKLGVPVLKAIVTQNTCEKWRETPQGLSPMDITMSIAMPEFDGMLITVPVAARQLTESDPLTGAKIVRYSPIAERVNKLVRLSINWAKLRHIPPEDKKVAIIFHNYPPRNDRIGCAFGLDSPVSVLNILRDMQTAGYHLDYLPESGQQLIEDIISKVTNDRRWSSPEQMAAKAVDKVSPAGYQPWFAELPASVQTAMTKQWGEPPGKLFNYGNNLLIPGIINGNVFIGLQPPRGYLDDPAAIYHSPDIPLPHHYYAYYHWIRNVFKADVIMHIGKHGSLEWLPGKSAGLSDCCFPDIAIADLPNIYPYIINNPGEGTQAKRRSYCCIIDHLIPVMHNADTYEEMAELEVLQKDYYQARTEDAGKLPNLRKMIWEKVALGKLDHDLQIDESAAMADFDNFLEKLHGYISEMADTQIRDGLHTFGEPPAGERLVEFLVALTRLSNGSIPSLRQSLAEMKNYNYDDLLANPGKRDAGGQSNAEKIQEIHRLALEMVSQLSEQGFAATNCSAVLKDATGLTNAKVTQVLRYICESIVPDIAATTDELTNTLAALGGSFISPGPSGAPTRGMADILPTGRNFYSVDPQAIPSPAAWKVGIAMGDALLERYLKDEGKYPQSIGIIIWGTGTMRTKGDDIAEILYLMGVRPVWEPSSGRVKGIEVIPLAELKRPRIDVTLRISGMFRDAFPNIVNLLDGAVATIAELKESENDNYIAAHVRQEVREKVAQGISPAQAREEAGYRIFGCKPGAYGAGVCDAIDAKNWQDQKDLGEIYVVWGGYAYGKKNYGITVPEQFKKRLSQLDVTVKNEDNREYDMLDSDDFYSYHGGMIAAVKAFKGELPRSYCGDGSDPDRVKVRSTAEETKHIFRSRVLNPKWIESMQRHGYKGAGDMSRLIDVAFGWDATAEVLEDWMYEQLAQKYALDKKMQDWLNEVNPYALQNITERLLEAVERGMWQADEEMKQELQNLYLSIEGKLEEDSQ